MASIRSRPSSEEYRKNFELIFGPKRTPKPIPCDYPGCLREQGHNYAHIVDDDSHPQAD